MKKCSKCKIEKSDRQFYRNQSDCKERQDIMYKARYDKDKLHYAEIKHNNIKIREDMVDKIKGEFGCSICGEKDFRCLDFHHKSDDKDKAVCKLVATGCRWQRVLDEIAKCIVICSNCHRKHHYRGTNQPS